MSQEVYRKLARHLDNLPSGFPATESGVELKILERLFTPKEAELATYLTIIGEEAKVVAKRAGIDVQEAQKQLETMARKGLIRDEVYDGKPPKYLAAHFALGIWELQVDKLTPELIKDVNEYLATFIDEGWAKMPQIRTIPVEASIGSTIKALPHEKALELLDQHNIFMVAPCICRQERAMADEGCKKPEHYCLLMGSIARLFHRNNVGRFVEKAEMAAMIKEADKHGLVLQPTNSREIVNICCCCGCCCGVLTRFKKYPRPGEMTHSAFITIFNQKSCIGCGICVVRCPMDALSSDGKIISFKPERCIGCGLCNTTCPTDSLVLIRRPTRKQPKVPTTLDGTMLRLAHKRGKLGFGELTSILFKSKRDRLLTLRSKGDE
jgi:formate hydrogenlyase subunit 6/NADH:ubiquinone oxidoreductase subunit I